MTNQLLKSVGDNFWLKLPENLSKQLEGQKLKILIWLFIMKIFDPNGNAKARKSGWGTDFLFIAQVQAT